MTDETFERLARTYGNAVFRVACHALGNRHDAEDATQNTLLRLYRADVTFASDEHARRWLLRVAVNESRRLLRSPRRSRPANNPPLLEKPALRGGFFLPISGKAGILYPKKICPREANP